MEGVLLNVLRVTYAAVGIIVVVGYWPTIKDLYFYKKKSANSVSYLIWCIAAGIVLLYSLFILSDLLFRIVSFINFLSCLVILILSLRLHKVRK